MNVQKTIKELIQFYVQMNYEKHLKDNNIKCNCDYKCVCLIVNCVMCIEITSIA